MQRLLGKSINNKGWRLQAKILSRVKGTVEANLRHRVPYHLLFPDGSVNRECAIDDVFFLARANTEDLECMDVAPEFMAKKMVPCLDFEGRIFREYYDSYKFAYPGRVDKTIEAADNSQQKIMTEAFTGKKNHYVRIPNVSQDEQHVYQRLREIVNNCV